MNGVFREACCSPPAIHSLESTPGTGAIKSRDYGLSCRGLPLQNLSAKAPHSIRATSEAGDSDSAAGNASQIAKEARSRGPGLGASIYHNSRAPSDAGDKAAGRKPWNRTLP
jgi:hypothetical protein